MKAASNQKTTLLFNGSSILGCHDLTDSEQFEVRMLCLKTGMPYVEAVRHYVSKQKRLGDF